MSFITAIKKEWMEQLRTRKFLIALIVLTLFGMTSPLLARFTPQMMSMIPGAEAFAGLIPEPTINDAVAQYLKNLTQFGILLALLFGMGAIAVEKEKGTAALVLSKPISRTSFILGKFAVLGLTFLLAVALAAIGGYYYTHVLFGALDLTNWLALNGLLYLYILLYTTITLFFSTLTRTQYVAIGGAFGSLIVFGILSSIPGWASYLPDGLIQNASLLITRNPISSWMSLWVTLGIIATTLTLACLVFRKQEL